MNLQTCSFTLHGRQLVREGSSDRRLSALAASRPGQIASAQFCGASPMRTSAWHSLALSPSKRFLTSQKVLFDAKPSDAVPYTAMDIPETAGAAENYAETARDFGSIAGASSDASSSSSRSKVSSLASPLPSRARPPTSPSVQHRGFSITSGRLTRQTPAAAAASDASLTLASVSIRTGSSRQASSSSSSSAPLSVKGAQGVTSSPAKGTLSFTFAAPGAIPLPREYSAQQHNGDSLVGKLPAGSAMDTSDDGDGDGDGDDSDDEPERRPKVKREPEPDIEGDPPLMESVGKRTIKPRVPMDIDTAPQRLMSKKPTAGVRKAKKLSPVPLAAGPKPRKTAGVKRKHEDDDDLDDLHPVEMLIPRKFREESMAAKVHTRKSANQGWTLQTARRTKIQRTASLESASSAASPVPGPAAAVPVPVSIQPQSVDLDVLLVKLSLPSTLKARVESLMTDLKNSGAPTATRETAMACLFFAARDSNARDITEIAFQSGLQKEDIERSCFSLAQQLSLPFFPVSYNDIHARLATAIGLSDEAAAVMLGILKQADKLHLTKGKPAVHVCAAAASVVLGLDSASLDKIAHAVGVIPSTIEKLAAAFSQLPRD